jgi:hypothetical protein
MARSIPSAVRAAGTVLVRAAKALSTMLISLDGRRLPPPPIDTGEPEEYRP